MQNGLTTIYENNAEKIADLNRRIVNFEKRINTQMEVIEESRERLASMGGDIAVNQDKMIRYASYIKDAGESIAWAAKMIDKLRSELLELEGLEQF